VLGSIQFGVLELKIPLIVVLGHERCGAVKATIEAVEKHASPSGTDIDSLVAAIKPAVEQAETRGGDLLDEAVRAHVANVVAALKTKPVIGPAVTAGTVQVVGGRYDLDTGRVDIIVPA
jgi:carbonic anhydrase